MITKKHTIDNNKKVINFYKEEAEIYDADRFLTAQERYMDKSQKNIVLNMSNSWRNLKILEVGCGTGRFTIEIANRGAVIVGLDSSIPMLKKVVEIAEYIVNQLNLEANRERDDKFYSLRI